MSTAKQRREAAQRKLQRQIARREEEARKRRQQTIWLSIVAGAAVVGLVVWMVVASSSDNTDVQADSTCGYTAEPGGDSSIGMPSAQDLPKKGTVELQMATNRGDLTLELDRSGAPCAVNSFEFLASKGFFDDTICHRLTSGSFGVLQCGDPTGTGTGGPGYRYKQEEPTGSDPYPEGTVAMANSGQPASTGSQFFICYTSCATLPPNYSVVGTVIKGLDVVKTIGAEGTANGTTDGAPKSEVRINSVKVTS